MKLKKVFICLLLLTYYFFFFIKRVHALDSVETKDKIFQLKTENNKLKSEIFGLIKNKSCASNNDCHLLKLRNLNCKRESYYPFSKSKSNFEEIKQMQIKQALLIEEVDTLVYKLKFPNQGASLPKKLNCQQRPSGLDPWCYQSACIALESRAAAGSR